MGMSILRLSHHCILKAGHMFSTFTNVWMDRNFGPGWIIPIPDLDDIEDEIMIFR